MKKNFIFNRAMMDCDLSIRSLSFIDFLKFRLGKDNTRKSSELL